MARRIQAFEFMDQPWFPALLRGYVTDVLHAGHRVFRVYQMWLPLIARLMQESGERRLVDLCSGGGGPALAIVDQLRELHGLDANLTLTDLYPNRSALERINAAETPGVRYLERSVDATNVPEELGGIRTFFAGFHHLPAKAARSVLADAHRERRAICIFELTANSIVALLSYLTVPLLTWLLTPLTRPTTWSRLLLTYLLPVVPLLVTWEGMASHLRTYSVEELRELTAGLESDSYRWEAGYLRRFPIPYRFPYLVGQPLEPDRTASG